MLENTSIHVAIESNDLGLLPKHPPQHFSSPGKLGPVDNSRNNESSSAHARNPGRGKLSILCGVEIAIVVFSPGKKVFSFGHPNVEQILDKFLNPQNPSPTNSTSLQLVQTLRSARARLLNTEHRTPN